MPDASTVASLAAGFDDPADGSALKSRELVLDLLRLTPEPFSRRQFVPGHITATGLVFAPEGIRILLVHHRRLDRWLLPGGHVETEDASVADAARREVIEETGALLSPIADGLAGIDVHGIPLKGDEPFHLHHDLLFAFRALDDEIRVSPESRAVEWCGPDEFDRYDLPGNVRRAYFRLR
jgi:8-oxo-dGTP pyrophosphatase MutT (NUDIX family)